MPGRSVAGNPINVYVHARNNDFWRTAKNSVYGPGSFLCGAEYRDLQNICNDNIRNKEGHAPLLKWAQDAPAECAQLTIHTRQAFKKRFQPFLELTPQGEGYLQRVLIQHFGTMRDPSVNEA